jgi:hypothetical protein
VARQGAGRSPSSRRPSGRHNWRVDPPLGTNARSRGPTAGVIQPTKSSNVRLRAFLTPLTRSHRFELSTSKADALRVADRLRQPLVLPAAQAASSSDPDGILGGDVCAFSDSMYSAGLAVPPSHRDSIERHTREDALAVDREPRCCGSAVLRTARCLIPGDRYSAHGRVRSGRTYTGAPTLAPEPAVHCEDFNAVVAKSHPRDLCACRVPGGSRRCVARVPPLKKREGELSRTRQAHHPRRARIVLGLRTRLEVAVTPRVGHSGPNATPSSTGHWFR